METDAERDPPEGLSGWIVRLPGVLFALFLGGLAQAILASSGTEAGLALVISFGLAAGGLIGCSMRAALGLPLLVAIVLPAIPWFAYRLASAGPIGAGDAFFSSPLLACTAIAVVHIGLPAFAGLAAGSLLRFILKFSWRHGAWLP